MTASSVNGARSLSAFRSHLFFHRDTGDIHPVPFMNLHGHATAWRRWRKVQGSNLRWSTPGPQLATGLLMRCAAKTPVNAGSRRWALQDSNLGPSGYEPGIWSRSLRNCWSSLPAVCRTVTGCQALRTGAWCARAPCVPTDPIGAPMFNYRGSRLIPSPARNDTDRFQTGGSVNSDKYLRSTGELCPAWAWSSPGRRAR